jgi:hypothetical protein
MAANDRDFLTYRVTVRMVNYDDFVNNRVWRGAILLGNEVWLLWEWLPATIASRQDAAPTAKMVTFFGSPISAHTRVNRTRIAHSGIQLVIYSDCRSFF